MHPERDWYFIDEDLDRRGWHPSISWIYDYWRAISPAGRLPGRQHMDPLDIAPVILPDIWLLDVVRPGPRFRFRLIGTEIVRKLGRDFTGRWLDETDDAFRQRPEIIERYVATVETGRPTYRIGPARITRTKEFEMLQNIFLPLAADGETVDILLALSIGYPAKKS